MSPCYPSQLKKFPFTTDEVKAIWEHAKTNYIDKGADFQTTIDGVSNDLALHPKYILQAFNEPKGTRKLSNEMYRKMAARREAQKQAKIAVRSLDTPQYAKIASTIYNIPRTVATAFHYAVFPVTHAGDLALRATQWNHYFKTVFDSYRFINRATHERLMTELVNSPNYTIARRGGLQNAPDIEPQGILTKGMGGASRRGFDSLKITRQVLFDQQWKKLAPENQDLEMSRTISDWANKATGAYNGKVPFASLQFAPQLNAARWSRALLDPITTVKTFANWKNATAADRQVAIIRARNAGEFAATYASLLAVNQGLLAASGSKDRINFNDPRRSDWLQFKIAGHVVGIGSGVFDVYRFIGKLAAISRTTAQERHGKSKTDEAATVAGQYAAYKLNPTLGLVTEAVMGEDRLTKRPLPWSNEKGTAKRPRMPLGEYLGEHGPIFLSGGTREVYDSMREQGVSSPDATAILKGAISSTIEATGVRFYPTSPPKAAGSRSSASSAPAWIK